MHLIGNLLLSVDPSLGRFNKHSLSQQQICEFLIEGITNKDKICGDNDHPLDINEWKDFHFKKNGEIIEVSPASKHLEGSLALEWLPVTVTEVYFSFNNLSGTVCLTELPDTLKKMSLASNQFSGHLDLTNLPTSLTMLCLDNNRFAGATDFSRLHASLGDLNVSKNVDLAGVVSDFHGYALGIRGTKVEDRRSK